MDFTDGGGRCVIRKQTQSTLPRSLGAQGTLPCSPRSISVPQPATRDYALALCCGKHLYRSLTAFEPNML